MSLSNTQSVVNAIDRLINTLQQLHTDRNAQIKSQVDAQAEALQVISRQLDTIIETLQAIKKDMY